MVSAIVHVLAVGGVNNRMWVVVHDKLGCCGCLAPQYEGSALWYDDLYSAWVRVLCSLLAFSGVLDCCIKYNGRGKNRYYVWSSDVEVGLESYWVVVPYVCLWSYLCKIAA